MCASFSKLLSTATSFCLLACLSSGSLISHWKFDESTGSIAADVTAAFPGTLAGSATWMPGQGIAGGAISCAAAGNGYVNMGNGVPTLAETNYTLIAWIKTTGTGNQVIGGKHFTGFFNGYLLGAGTGAGYGGANKAWSYNGGSPAQSPVSTTSVNNGVWHQIVGVRVGSIAQIYVNGNLEDTRPANGSAATTVPFLIGGVAFSGNPGNSFTGLIDEVQLYDEALCIEQIQYLFQNPATDIANDVTVSGALQLANYEGPIAGLTVNVNFIDCYSRVLQSTDAVLSANGEFSVATRLRGSFYVSAKVSHWLRQGQSAVMIGDSGVSDLGFDLMNGDAVDDNEINLVDYGSTSAAFGSIDGDPNWNAMADLNGDGEVNLVDVGIVSANFGTAGDD